LIESYAASPGTALQKEDASGNLRRIFTSLPSNTIATIDALLKRYSLSSQIAQVTKLRS
jgi:hypothetical protein